jgi:hypothetical protein
MPEAARMWTEVTFNIAYLVAIWTLVALMWVRRERVAPADQHSARLITGAFALLALGDTGHVGFRVLAYALGGLEGTSLAVFGHSLGLVGLGALATAITVTLFYALFLLVWQDRFDRSLGWFGLLLLIMAALRLVLMIPAVNQWNSVVPPQPWSLVRNAPLVVQGLGVAYLILRDARAARDRTFIWIGINILVSYACYLPVILFVQQAPLVGMLMIPKTLAYIAVAVLAYRGLWRSNEPASAALKLA